MLFFEQIVQFHLPVVGSIGINSSNSSYYTATSSTTIHDLSYPWLFELCNSFLGTTCFGFIAPFPRDSTKLNLTSYCKDLLKPSTITLKTQLTKISIRPSHVCIIPTRRRNQPRTVPSHMDQCIISRTHRHIKPRTSTGILPYLVRTRVLGYHTAEKFPKRHNMET